MEPITVTFYQPSGNVLHTYRIAAEDEQDAKQQIERIRERLLAHRRN